MGMYKQIPLPRNFLDEEGEGREKEKEGHR
jgi:hypothetical protein